MSTQDTPTAPNQEPTELTQERFRAMEEQFQQVTKHNDALSGILKDLVKYVPNPEGSIVPNHPVRKADLTPELDRPASAPPAFNDIRSTRPSVIVPPSPVVVVANPAIAHRDIAPHLTDEEKRLLVNRNREHRARVARTLATYQESAEGVMRLFSEGFTMAESLKVVGGHITMLRYQLQDGLLPLVIQGEEDAFPGMGQSYQQLRQTIEYMIKLIENMHEHLEGPKKVVDARAEAYGEGSQIEDMLRLARYRENHPSNADIPGVIGSPTFHPVFHRAHFRHHTAQLKAQLAANLAYMAMIKEVIRLEDNHENPRQ